MSDSVPAFGSIDDRTLGLLAALGPVSFIAAWVLGGWLTDMDYSPVPEPISRLASAGSDVQLLMSAGFVAFGFLGFAFALVLLRLHARWAAASATLTSVATFGVAAAPLGYSDMLNWWHGFTAIGGYTALVATPVLAYRTLDARSPWLARSGMATAAIAVLCLLLMPTELPTGLFQRLGLTAVHSWIIVVGLRARSVRERQSSGASWRSVTA